MTVASVTCLLGLHIIRSSGYRLTSYRNVAAVPASLTEPTVDSANGVATKTDSATPFDLDTPEQVLSTEVVAANKRRVQFRIAVVGLIVVTALLNAAVWAAARGRTEQVLASIVEDGGVVEYTAGKPISIDFGPNNVNGHLTNLPAIDTLQTLKLNRCSDVPIWNLRKFTSLQSIDLRNVEFHPGMLSTSIPTGTKVTIWSDQLDKPELAELQQYGMVVELIDR